jgi:hypothetical protein
MARSFYDFCGTNPDAAQRMLEAAGNKIARLKARGICTHGWMQGPPGKAVLTCLDCGATFASDHEHQAARRKALNT